MGYLPYQLVSRISEPSTCMLVYPRFTGVNPSAVRCPVRQEIVLDEEDEDLQIHVTCTKVSNISDSSWGGSPEKKRFKENVWASSNLKAGSFLQGGGVANLRPLKGRGNP